MILLKNLLNKNIPIILPLQKLEPKLKEIRLNYHMKWPLWIKLNQILMHFPVGLANLEDLMIYLVSLMVLVVYTQLKDLHQNFILEVMEKLDKILVI